VEYGKILRWRQGEIIGLGSSSIVYTAIRVDNNTLLAVKKFKVVSDVSGIDQNKLKTIKVSLDFNLINSLLYRTKSKNTSNSSTRTL
jgi:hypothetical protein